MAGIYIPGMEMPRKKNGAVLIVYPDGRCAFENGKEYKAVPVPPHGDLIDKQALFNGEHNLYSWAEIDEAPTIIPADKEV